jgi:hypothetical protein
MTVEKFYNYQNKLVNMLNAENNFENYNFDVSILFQKRT